MSSIADKLGLGPTRELRPNGDGTTTVTVTPPAATGFAPSRLTLTKDQLARYFRWQNGELMIQDAFPELSASQREILQTGIGPEEWNTTFGEGSPDLHPKAEDAIDALRRLVDALSPPKESRFADTNSPAIQKRKAARAQRQAEGQVTRRDLVEELEELGDEKLIDKYNEANEGKPIGVIFSNMIKWIASAITQSAVANPDWTEDAIDRERDLLIDLFTLETCKGKKILATYRSGGREAVEALLTKSETETGD